MDQQSPGGSVTFWLRQLKAGVPAAAQPLWDEYFARLVALARARLREVPRGAADEEDVALSAFDSFCAAAAAGRFPRLDDRDDLWQVLFVITTRKAIGLVHRETCAKRGGPREERPTAPTDVAQLATAEPTPDDAAAVAESWHRLLDALNEPSLRAVAVWKMEGYTNDEIAAKLDRAVSSVERKLRLIRRIWGRAGAR